jgi:hypothetical protein
MRRNPRTQGYKTLGRACGSDPIGDPVRLFQYVVFSLGSIRLGSTAKLCFGSSKLGSVTEHGSGRLGWQRLGA